MALGTLTTTVLPDANVLFSRTLRDWLGLCALHGPDGWYEVRWTEDILAETLYHLRRKNPAASDAQIGGIRDKIVAAFSGGRIAGYPIDPTIVYPDIFDAHVHAAAVHGGVDFVLTADRDFEKLAEILDSLPYEVHSPDSFFCLLDDSSPRSIRLVIKEQIDYWSKRQGLQLVHPAGQRRCAAVRRASARTPGGTALSPNGPLRPLSLGRKQTTPN